MYGKAEQFNLMTFVAKLRFAGLQVCRFAAAFRMELACDEAIAADGAFTDAAKVEVAVVLNGIGDLGVAGR
jgi:hypothetical protein